MKDKKIINNINFRTVIREFLPYNSNSLGRIKDIGYVFGNYFYMYSICQWANGEYGSIIDFFSATDDVDDNGNSKIYFDKYTPFLQFVKGDIDLVGNDDCLSVCSDLRKNSPTVAIGFIAFFLLTEFSKRDYPAMYNEYYEIEKKVYTNHRRRTDPYCFDVNFDEEFSNGKHLLSEKENIKFSIKNLFPYLQEEDREFIKKVSDAYIKYVESRTTKEGNIRKSRKGNSRKTGKKPFDPDTFRETFTYRPDGMNENERNIRLKLAFNRMQGILIDRETHYDTFEALLSGKPLDTKIVWTGTNSQLRELFKLLVTKEQIIKKPTGGINQILTARFKKKNGKPFTAKEIKDSGSDGDMSVVEDVVKDLTHTNISIDDLEQELKNLIKEEQTRGDMRGKKDNKYQEHLPSGMHVSATPNRHTRKN